MNYNDIGVFDTGLGGLTVLKELYKELPNENYIYFGDTKRVPYGPRSQEEIIDFTMDIVNFLVDKKVKALVIGCNTISSIALDTIRERVEIPVIGVIDPGVKMALRASKNKNIGVVATEGTINSHVYQDKILRHYCNVSGVACPDLVTIAETGVHKVGLARVNRTTKNYMDRFQNFDLDTLILGCTHFPILEDSIRDYFGPGVNIINPAYETAKETKKVLGDLGLINPSSKKGLTRFYVSKDKDYFKKLGEQILEEDMEILEEVNFLENKYV